ncbi:type IIL restriction-modification enzyme MmeI [Thiocapsa sp.]|uniref:type IIL restriction-modification enzyme MmeI n=1 Tax=Thiocapsa sp. TaxID=2024551 RepID=UPI002BEFF7A9|nr:type IIL restriction-modification enzyme MmeI [Thiocapsa sp.]HSO81357.1 type IIL restriction-modification enzyme MmeI [Thiocapsa sp.]
MFSASRSQRPRSVSLLLAREAHFPATIADLNDADTMPDDLRAAHDRNGEVLERIDIGRRFKNGTERLEKLFERYTKMTAPKTLPVTPAIVARGAERHGACVTPQSGCHERLIFWVAGLTSEARARGWTRSGRPARRGRRRRGVPDLGDAG